VTEQSTGAGVPFANFIYRGFNPAPSSFQKHATWKAAMSYITGSHTMKWGYQAGYMSNINTTYVGRQISYRFNNGVPNQMSQRVGTNETSNSLLYNGFYIQDQWTRKRLTLQGALRYESASSWAPAGENGILTDNEFGGPNLIPRTDGVQGYHDITPRMGAAYDVFGNGKTAIKTSLSRYVASEATEFASSVNPLGGSFSPGVTDLRTWNDSNGHRVPTLDDLGPSTNLAYGSTGVTTVAADNVRSGWGARKYNWEYVASIQHELLPGLALSTSYYRRWFGNLTYTQNLLVAPSDYTPFTLVSPLNGEQIKQYNLSPAKRGLFSGLVAFAPNDSILFNGLDFLLNGKFGRGGIVSGGVSIGRTVTSTCTSGSPSTFAASAPDGKASKDSAQDSSHTPLVQITDADSMRVQGEQRFHANCGRCHATPQKFPPRVMATVIRHMRVRATITDADMRLILSYMTQ